MPSAYTDLASVHNPSAGANDAPATWGDAVNANHDLFAYRFKAHVYNSAGQNISDTTSTTLTFDSERYDNDTIHSTVSNTGRLTANRAGVFLIWCAGAFAANATGSSRILNAYRNGTDMNLGAFEGNPSSTAEARLGVTFTYPAGSGDYFEFKVYHDAGTTIAATFEAAMCWLAES